MGAIGLAINSLILDKTMLGTSRTAKKPLADPSWHLIAWRHLMSQELSYTRAQLTSFRILEDAQVRGLAL